MNRTIEFRAKSCLTNEWVYGHYYYDIEKKKHYIIYGSSLHTSMSTCEDSYNVITEIDYKTLSQFTGKKDCYDKKVYTGDLISDRPNGKYICEVIFENDLLAFASRNIKTGGIIYLNNFTYAYIIGNIHQHAHLLNSK